MTVHIQMESYKPVDDSQPEAMLGSVYFEHSLGHVSAFKDKTVSLLFTKKTHVQSKLARTCVAN